MSALVFRQLPLPHPEPGIIWAVVGDAGATSLTAMLWPASLTTESTDAAMIRLGAVRTDAGWLTPVDLGVHRHLDDPRGGLVEMETCPLFDGEPCWYGGSALGAYVPLKAWERAGHDDRVIEAALRAHYAAQLG